MINQTRCQQLARIAKTAKARKDLQDARYFSRRKVAPGRDFLIVCRHWNSSTPIIPRDTRSGRPYARLSGGEVGGGYFLVLNGVGIVVDPGYNFMQMLYASCGYSIRDIDYVFITHDHPDHWADLPTILNLSHMAKKKKPTNEPDNQIAYYLNRCTNELRDFLFSDNSSACHTIGRGQVVPLIRSEDEMLVALATGLCAFHCERQMPKSNSPDAIGLYFSAKPLDPAIHGLRNIAIAGDTQFPSVDKRKAGLCEFTPEDVEEFAKEYDSGDPGAPACSCKRGTREIDVLAMHIGSVENSLAQIEKWKGDPREYILNKDNQVFYDGYHLGFGGCLRLLDMVFKSDQADKVAILTEFGEELRGYRVDLAMMVEGMTRANPGDSPGNHPHVRVMPADLGLALQLTWKADQQISGARLRCSKCTGISEFERSIRATDGVDPSHSGTEMENSDKDFDPMDEDFFHPISLVQPFEDMETGQIQYCCHW